jgi:cob(I)alamin adenosyltransferase
MVYINKVYTRSGDQGITGLGDGSRVSKAHPRIQAIGAVDELNAAIGIVRSQHYTTANDIEKIDIEENRIGLKAELQIRDELIAIQHDLFDLGADLCTPLHEDGKLRIVPEHITKLEASIDYYTSLLQPLHSFVLPGGNLIASYVHLARTICRRAERDIITMADASTINPEIIVYLNRLSDYLFVAGRIFNNRGESDVLWTPGKNLPKH